jgi:hypothetical protein
VGGEFVPFLYIECLIASLGPYVFLANACVAHKRIPHGDLLGYGTTQWHLRRGPLGGSLLADNGRGRFEQPYLRNRLFIKGNLFVVQCKIHTATLKVFRILIHDPRGDVVVVVVLGID